MPGSKKIDVSEIRRKLQVDVKKIVFLSHNSLAVSTSFGVLIYSTNFHNKTTFIVGIFFPENIDINPFS